MGGFLAPLIQLLGMAQGAAGGGLPALVAQLENAGLEERVRSWMGSGENLPVTEEELEQAFTPEQLNDWALKAGTTPGALLQVMAEQLPAAVNQANAPATPSSLGGRGS